MIDLDSLPDNGGCQENIKRKLMTAPIERGCTRSGRVFGRSLGREQAKVEKKSKNSQATKPFIPIRSMRSVAPTQGIASQMGQSTQQSNVVYQ